jgi:uncharacterized repeat protein (TIGR03803 family)
MRCIFRGIILSLAFLGLTGGASAGPAETVLYSFKGGPYGSTPYGGVIADAQGVLYGTTSAGGLASPGIGGGGTIYKVTPPPAGQTVWGHSVLYSFKGGVYGGTPFTLGGDASLIQDAQGVLYGVTYLGGITGGQAGNGYGTFYKLTPPAAGQSIWTHSVLYTFKGGVYGENPNSGLIADTQGTLYGTTQNGGAAGGCGTVYKLVPPASGQTTWQHTVIYSFIYSNIGNGKDDSCQPLGGVILDAQGALYGTTDTGGGWGAGTVYKLTPPAPGKTTWAETILYRFCKVSPCPDGATPQAGLVFDAQGALYGTTVGGGIAGPSGESAGLVFKLTPNSSKTVWTESVLYSFLSNGPKDGTQPHAGLTFDSQGALYGTTASGGTKVNGTVFKLTPAAGGAWTETVLYNFGSKTNYSDGADPYSGLIIDKQNALYGTTISGAVGPDEGTGTVFKVTQ